MKRSILAAFAVCLMPFLHTGSQASVISVNIAETETAISSFFGNHATHVLFNSPTDGTPVTVTGAIDISGMNTGDAADNSVLMVGLISKVAFDAEPGAPGDNFFGLFDSVWASFLYRGNSGFNAALGQRTMSGADSALVIYGHGSNPATPATMTDGILNDGEFEAVFGTTQLALTILGDTITMPYDLGAVDFSQGAYAFAGAFLNKPGGTDTFDVTFTQQVPEPGTLALFGLGLAGFGVARRRRSA